MWTTNYNFMIKDENGKIIESCGGFYGYDDNIQAEAISILDSLPVAAEFRQNDLFAS